MKPRTYFRLALWLPLLLWGLCALVTVGLQARNVPWNPWLAPLMFYVFGILIWLLPYLALAAGLWIWSRERSTPALMRAAWLAPIPFAALLWAEVLLITLGSEGSLPSLNEVLGQGWLLGCAGLGFGYLCVGMALLIFKLVQGRHWILEERPVTLLQT